MSLVRSNNWIGLNGEQFVVAMASHVAGRRRAAESVRGRADVCDSAQFTVEVLTLAGLRGYLVFFVIEL